MSIEKRSIYIKKGTFIYLCDYNFIINKEIEKEFIKYKRFRKIEVRDIIISRSKLSREVKKIRQLQFEVTQNCNLNCKYCVYGEHYDRRKKAKKELEYKTAKAAIDYVFNIISKRYKKEFDISFYGGEPLLNFETIEKIVEYAKNKFINWKINFHITTNGTLLDKKKINFFIKNNFHVLISLDGPKEIHDEKRIYAHGKGSFRKIMLNLNELRDTNENFYNKNISFSSVWSFDLSLKKIYDFYTKEELVKYNEILLSPLDPGTKSYFKEYTFDKEKKMKEFSNIINLIENKKKKKIKINTFEYNILGIHNSIENMLFKRFFTTLYGTCLFNLKVFLDVDGFFHICHMVEESWPIGDAWNGLNFNKMKELSDKFIYLNKVYCNNCKYKFLCRRCFAQSIKKGKINIKNFSCENRKKSIQEQLERYVNYKIKYK